MARYGPLTPLVIDEPEDAIAPDPANPDRMLRQTAPRPLINPNTAGQTGNNAPQPNQTVAGPPVLTNYSLAPMSTVHPLDAMKSPGIVVLRAEFIKLNWQVTLGASYFPGNSVNPSVTAEYLFRLFINDSTQSARIADTNMVHPNTIFDVQGGLFDFQTTTTLTRPLANGGCENIGTVNHQRLTVDKKDGNSLMNICYSANYGQEGTEAVFSIYDNSNPRQLIAHILAFRQSVFLRLADNQVVLTKEHKAVLFAAAIKIYCSVFKMHTYPLPFNLVDQYPHSVGPPPTPSLNIFLQENLTSLRLRAACYQFDCTTLYVEAFTTDHCGEVKLVFASRVNEGMSACMDHFGQTLFISNHQFTDQVMMGSDGSTVADIGIYTLNNVPNFYYAPYSAEHPIMVEQAVEIGQGIDIPTVFQDNPPTHRRAHYFYHFGTNQLVGEIQPEKGSVLVTTYGDAAADERAMIYSTAITLAITDYQLSYEIVPRFRGYCYRPSS